MYLSEVLQQTKQFSTLNLTWSRNFSAVSFLILIKFNNRSGQTKENNNNDIIMIRLLLSTYFECMSVKNLIHEATVGAKETAKGSWMPVYRIMYETLLESFRLLLYLRNNRIQNVKRDSRFLIAIAVWKLPKCCLSPLPTPARFIQSYK